MTSGPYERVLETLEDLDARLAGLEVSYSETNAVAAEELVAQLDSFFENDPEHFAALQTEVDQLVAEKDASHAVAAKEHADALKRRVEAQAEEG